MITTAQRKVERLLVVGEIKILHKTNIFRKMLKTVEIDDTGVTTIDLKYDTRINRTQQEIISYLKPGDIIKPEHLIILSALVRFYQLSSSDITKEMILKTRKEIKRLLNTEYENVNKNWIKSKTLGQLQKNLADLERKLEKIKPDEKNEKSLFEIRKEMKG